MNNNTTIIIVTILITLMIGASIAIYPLLPEQVATHWNAEGQVNGYSSRSFGTFFLPGLTLFLTALFMLLPAIDPLRSNIEKFRGSYNTFVVFLAVFMLYIHALTLVWNLGYRFDLTFWMIPAMGGLMYLVGVILGKAKRNYFIGIRTPWTLQSETVWNKTHARGAVAFKIVGLVSLLGIFFPRAFLIFLIFPLMVVTTYLVGYSYYVYRQEEAERSTR